MTDQDVDEHCSDEHVRSTKTASKKPTIRQSCEACRRSKTKCLLLTNDTKCQKCRRDGKSCEYLAARQRPKKLQTTRSRMADMESRLEGLLSKLAAQRPSVVSEASLASTIPLTARSTLSTSGSEPIYTPSTSSGTPPQLHETQQPISNQQEPTRLAINVSMSAKTDVQDGDVIDRGIVSHHTADAYLDFYRSIAFNFPFVVLPRHESLHTVRQSRPFTLLAIFAYVSLQDAPLQSIIDDEFREAMSRRIVKQGERSLDLLQGVLIYTAYYQFFLKPFRQQMYQLISMAVNMATELGLLDPTDEKYRPGSGYRGSQWAYDLELRRASLGVYYLSSSFSLGLRKPNVLRHSRFIDHHAQVVTASNVYPSDSHIAPLVCLQKLAEEINAQFDYDGVLGLPSLGPMRTAMAINTYSRQLEEISRTWAPEFSLSEILTSTLQNTTLLLHETIFYADPEPTWDIPILSQYHLTTLSSARSILDAAISAPDSSYKTWPLSHWIHIAYAALVLGNFCSPKYTSIAIAGLDLSYLSQSLESYLSLIADRAGAISDTVVKVPGMPQGFFCYFEKIMRNSEMWRDGGDDDREEEMGRGQRIEDGSAQEKMRTLNVRELVRFKPRVENAALGVAYEGRNMNLDCSRESESQTEQMCEPEAKAGEIEVGQLTPGDTSWMMGLLGEWAGEFGVDGSANWSADLSGIELGS